MLAYSMAGLARIPTLTALPSRYPNPLGHSNVSSTGWKSCQINIYCEPARDLKLMLPKQRSLNIMSNENEAVSKLTRYEIVLPRYSNDGVFIPDDLRDLTFRQVALRFKGASMETQGIRGIWYNGDHPQQEENSRLFIDVEDTQESLEWFIEFKQMLRSRFQQIDIWMTRHPIEFIK